MNLSRRISAHAMAEYVALAALADGAPGVPGTLIDSISPLLAEAASKAAYFQDVLETEGLSDAGQAGQNGPDP